MFYVGEEGDELACGDSYARKGPIETMVCDDVENEARYTGGKGTDVSHFS